MQPEKIKKKDIESLLKKNYIYIYIIVITDPKQKFDFHSHGSSN